MLNNSVLLLHLTGDKAPPTAHAIVVRVHAHGVGVVILAPEIVKSVRV